MKKKRLLIMALAASLMMTGCASAMEQDSKNNRSVAIQEVKIEKGNETLDYIGVVGSKEIVKYSFKTPGQIETIYVEKGQKVKAGDPLAKLDERELKFAISAAEAALGAAELDVVQAKEARNYDRDNLKKMKALLDEQAISQDLYNQVSLKTTVSEEKYKQALEQVKGLSADLAHKTYLKNHATLVADTDGLIVDVLYEENEQVAAFYPVVAVRSVVQVVNVGIAQKDIDKLVLGTPATIDFYGNASMGEITQIADAPDTDTRTYNGEITLNASDYRLGAITKVAFNVGEIEGIWVPVNAILSEGEDYVYVAKDGRAFKKTINIVEIDNGQMMVEGLEVGDQVIISGMKNLLDGMEINISEE